MKYREQCENYWPTPDELKELKRNSGYKRPPDPPRIFYDADCFGWFVAAALVCLWISSL